MKKSIICFIMIIAGILCMIKPVKASSSDLYLNNLEFNAQINDDGSMNVTEKWNIKIEDTNTLYKTFKKDNSKYSQITNVEVKDITAKKQQMLTKANQWSYHLPKNSYFGGLNKDDEFEIAWGVGLEDNSAI